MGEEPMIWGHWPDPGIRAYYGTMFDGNDGDGDGDIVL